MKNVKTIIISIIFGAILSSIIWTGFIYSSTKRDNHYKELYNQVRNTNRELTESIRNREATIRGLQYYNNQLRITNTRFEESIRSREAIIIEARGAIKGATTSLDKLEHFIKLLQKLEQDSNTFNHN